MGQLVTDSRFLMASPHSYRVRSTGAEGSLPFFEKKIMDRALAKTRTRVEMPMALVRPGTSH
jgi:hypothetical protein